jgi:2-polyprenyl-3-methyl-5-hydroxy-6-metoxy-1,4-benzoquinol methylase
MPPPSVSWQTQLESWLENPSRVPSEAAFAPAAAAILRNSWATPESVFRVAMIVLGRDPAVAAALAAEDAVPGLTEVLARPLTRLVLSQCLVTALPFERVLTRLRRAIALGLVGAPLDAIVALAQQCWLNEFLWDEQPEERDAIVKRGTAPEDLAIRACYGPVTDPDLPAELHALHIDQPAEEARLAHAMPSFGATADATSIAVQQQYEANPYPRWQVCRFDPPRTLGEFIGGTAPDVGHRPSQPGGDEILIAGCGTGLQAVQAAAQFPATRITALDLSRASLGYAARKAATHAQKNIAFVHGDLLAAPDQPGWRERFDFIECLGVLHHLRDPGQGLAALSQCLRPGGLMYLGLYSAVARQSVADARRLIAAEKLSSDAAGIRRFRALVATRIGKPGVLADKLQPLTEFIDYFSMSMCRDLAFHVQEHVLAPREIAALAEGAHLNLLGFGISDPRLAALYAQANPSDPMVRDVRRIAAFERRHPRTFAAMYLVLLGKPAA